jgi:hypothetical protein
MSTASIPQKSTEPRHSRLAIVLAVTLLAHLGFLGLGAWLEGDAAPPPARETSRIARVLVGHIDPDRGDLQVDGYAMARVRN